MEARIDAERRARALRPALESLGAGERAVLELVAEHDLTPAEAAGVLGILPVAARVRLSRARRRLVAAEAALNAAREDA